MKVLHLLKTTIGAAWAVKLLREQVLLGLEVHVILPDKKGNAKLYEQSGCHVHYDNIDIAITKPWLNVHKIIKLRRLIRSICPDIVHSHFVSTTLIMRLAMVGIPIPRVFQVPGPLHLEHVFFRNLDYYLSSSTDHWIGTCQWTVDKYIDLGVSPQNVHLSYYGTDIDLFVSKKPVNLRKKIGISNDVITIGMVAYMYPPKYFLGQRRGLKGHEDLIDAVDIVKKTYPNIHLIFVGGDWNKAIRYKNDVESYGTSKLFNAVTFLGNRNDVLDLYNSIDIAVFPSHSENVGGAVESLLMKVPTITSNVGGFPDLVMIDKTGMTVPSKKPDKLAEAIIFYIENKEQAQREAAEGCKLARELFDVKKTARETLHIYNNILTKD